MFCSDCSAPARASCCRCGEPICGGCTSGHLEACGGTALHAAVRVLLVLAAIVGLALLLTSCAAVERAAISSAAETLRDMRQARLAASFEGTLPAPTWAGSVASLQRRSNLMYGGGWGSWLRPRATGRGVGRVAIIRQHEYVDDALEVVGTR